MSIHCLGPLTEDEMYALEFSPEELCDEPAAEEPEVEYDCPACHATELQYAMHYRVSDDDETQELYRCARCGATGEAEDCRVETIARRQKRAGAYRPPERCWERRALTFVLGSALVCLLLLAPPGRGGFAGDLLAPLLGEGAADQAVLLSNLALTFWS